MKLLTFFRKPAYSIFMSVFVLFYSCNPSGEVPQIQPELTSEYFNYVLSKSSVNSNATFKDVVLLSNSTLEKIKNKSQNRDLTNYSEESFSATILSNDEEITLHILPLTNQEMLNQAHVFYEKNGELFTNYIEVTVNNNGDDYVVNWITFYDSTERSEECNGSIVSCDCQEGSDDVSDIGAVIAAAGLFGCIVCAFVGGAIMAVAAAGSLACPDEGSQP